MDGWGLQAVLGTVLRFLRLLECNGLKEMRGKVWTEFQIPGLGLGWCKHLT